LTAAHLNRPDLHAQPGVLEFIVAANPHVVIGMLDEIQRLEEKCSQLQK